jgi:uncharacterized metal-binding protein
MLAFSVASRKARFGQLKAAEKVVTVDGCPFEWAGKTMRAG